MRYHQYSVIVFILLGWMLARPGWSQHLSEGQIQRRQGKMAVVEISLGWELTLNQNVWIYRVLPEGRKEIGMAQVVKIRDQKAIIQIQKENPKLPIKRGDTVTSSRQEDYSDLLVNSDPETYSFKLKAGWCATPLNSLNQSITQMAQKWTAAGFSITNRRFPDGTLFYGGEIGRRLGPWLKTTVGGNALFNQVQMQSTSLTSRIDLKQQLQHYNLHLNGYLVYENTLSNFTLYVGAGGAFSYIIFDSELKYYPDLNAATFEKENYQKKGSRITEYFLVGFDIKFTRHWGIALEGGYHFCKILVKSPNNTKLPDADQMQAYQYHYRYASNIDMSGGTLALGLVYYR